MEQEIIITERNEEKIYLNDVTKDDLIIVRKKGRLLVQFKIMILKGGVIREYGENFLMRFNLSDLIMIEELKGCKFSRIK